MRRIADPLIRAAAVNPAMVKVYVVDDRDAERLRRRRAEHLPQHRAADRARHHRRAARGHRPRARPHHRRAPDPARPGDGRGARHRRDRHARRGGGGGRRRARGQRRHRRRHRARRRSAARWPTAAPRRRPPTRPACATSRRPAATRGRCSTCSSGSARHEALTGRYADPYAQNHPMWSDRIAMLEERVAALPPGDASVGRGRLLARADGGEARRLPRQPGADAAPLPRGRRLRRRGAGPGDRLAPTSGPRRGPTRRSARCIAARPEDAWLHDLEAQFRLEAGDAAGAAALWRQAVALGAARAADPRRPRPGAAQHRRRRG